MYPGGLALSQQNHELANDRLLASHNRTPNGVSVGMPYFARCSSLEIHQVQSVPALLKVIHFRRSAGSINTHRFPSTVVDCLFVVTSEVLKSVHIRYVTQQRHLKFDACILKTDHESQSPKKQVLHTHTSADKPHNRTQVEKCQVRHPNRGRDLSKQQLTGAGENPETSG